MIKVKATKDQRITVNGAKEDVKKGSVIEIHEEQVYYFLSNNFVRSEDVLKSDEIQTTDGGRKETRGRKRIVKKDFSDSK